MSFSKELFNCNLITRSELYELSEKYNLEKYFDFILNNNSDEGSKDEGK